MSETLKVSLVNVEIDRGRDVIAVAVPQHEVEVLRAVHGPDKVRVTGISGDTLTLAVSAEAEYDRLSRKYRRVNAPDPVRIAYSLGPSQLERAGFASGGFGDKAPQSLAIKHPAPEEVLPETVAPPVKAAKSA